MIMLMERLGGRRLCETGQFGGWLCETYSLRREQMFLLPAKSLLLADVCYVYQIILTFCLSNFLSTQTCYEWFRNGITDIDLETQTHMFQKEVLKIDPSKLSENGKVHSAGKDWLLEDKCSKICCMPEVLYSISSYIRKYAIPWIKL